MKASIVIYRGPSMLDGAPIVVLASVGSSNIKTGAMVQTWILRADVPPVDASKRSVDSSVCGQCPRRHSLGGDCYVQPWQAPRSVWDSWDRQGRPGENWADQSQILALQADALAYGLRLGSYGDPAAVPYTVWQDLIDALQPSKVVGYTHQWQVFADRSFDPSVTRDHYIWLRDHVMASCDTAAEAADARFLGWRTFTAIPAGTTPPEKSIQCPATRAENPLNCYQCGVCDGSQGRPNRASVYLAEHGARSQGKARKVVALQVIP